ncbi:hypothetical protein VHP8226_01419 [Vibrio hippocampi]|uniref:Uncharacterized protein n=1 Tax=Vibrio hippocampi TaxID=654686 RepID=A0ABM8ZGY9_9VIBR|nr:hypothetical protein VHP8226_01419 [Vibrio hippocampi]
MSTMALNYHGKPSSYVTCKLQEYDMLFRSIVLILFIVALLGWYLLKATRDLSQFDWDWDDDEIL